MSDDAVQDSRKPSFCRQKNDNFNVFQSLLEIPCSRHLNYERVGVCEVPEANVERIGEATGSKPNPILLQEGKGKYHRQRSADHRIRGRQTSMRVGFSRRCSSRPRTPVTRARTDPSRVDLGGDRAGASSR